MATFMTTYLARHLKFLLDRTPRHVMVVKLDASVADLFFPMLPWLVPAIRLESEVATTLIAKQGLAFGAAKRFIGIKLIARHN